MHKLQEQFSEFFPERGFAGFWAEAGWYDLLERLFVDLRKAVNEGAAQPTVMQVKEKFGTLRFYMNGGTEAMRERIRQAEWESARTCEVCGQPGKTLDRRGWYKTLCPVHAKELGYEVDGGS